MRDAFPGGDDDPVGLSGHAGSVLNEGQIGALDKLCAEHDWEASPMTLDQFREWFDGNVFDPSAEDISLEEETVSLMPDKKGGNDLATAMASMNKEEAEVDPLADENAVKAFYMKVCLAAASPHAAEHLVLCCPAGLCI